MAVERRSIPDEIKALLRPPSQDEIARRRRVVADILALRDAIGPVDLTVEELLAEEDEVNE